MSNEIKVADVDQVKELFTALKDKMNSLKIIDTPVPSFDKCSISQIKQFVNMYYNGSITLNQIKKSWNIGDSLTFTLPSVPNGGYVGEIQPQQSVTISILDFDHDALVDQTKKEKALITFGTDICLSTGGYMSSKNTNIGGWDACNRRSWCNNSLYNAIPSDIKELIKQVQKKATKGYIGGSKQMVTSNDYCWLFSTAELKGAGAANESNGLAADEGYQYKAFEDVSYRKKPNEIYYTRSAKYVDDIRFWVYKDDSFDQTSASTAFKIRFGFCI